MIIPNIAAGVTASHTAARAAQGQVGQEPERKERKMKVNRGMAVFAVGVLLLTGATAYLVNIGFAVAMLGVMVTITGAIMWADSL
jgi:hypothetical protein